jgi:hypothetical protein
MADWSNREFVLAELKKNGKSLEYAHDDFKNDREIVLVAVKRHGYALQFASDDLKKDKEIVLTAVIGSNHALEFAHDNLKNDEEFLYKVDQVTETTTDFTILYYISERIQTKIRENPDYLLDFGPVNLKPGKK